MATINPLMRPIDYSVDVQSPFEAALGGFKLGASVSEIQAAQQKRDLERQALERAQAAQTELQNLFTNPNATSADYARVSAFLPKDQAAIVTQGFERKTKDQQESDLKLGGQVYSAVKSGKLDIAKQRLQDSADAYRNSGREADARAAEDAIEFIDFNPTGAQATIGVYMARLPGGTAYLEAADKALATVRAEAKAPFELTETQAKAQSAAVAAKFAESNAVTDLTKKGWDITKVQEDIKIAKQNANIAAMNAATAKETNALKRQENELKLQEMIDKRDATVRQVTAEVESARGDMDNFLNTANRIKQTPREIINSATGPVASRLPTFGQQTADFEGLVETLGAQAFISQIPKIRGTGALSEKEGDKLQASLQNLSLKQSPDRLLENVNESIRLIEKARKTLSIKSGLPDTPMDIPSMELNVTVSGTTYNFPTKAAADAFKNSDAYKKAAGIK